MPAGGAVMSVVFMFSGQGSQYFQMGRPLHEANPRFRHWMTELDTVAADWVGESVVAAIYDPDKRRSDPFTDVVMSSSAIFMTECALAFTLRDEGIEPDFVMGASLGELAAGVVARVLAAERAMALVVGQARAMVARCAPGTVAAVLAESQAFRDDPVLHENADIGFDSRAAHFVIGGDRVRMATVLSHFRERGVPVHELPVAYGFHSYNLDPAADDCRRCAPRDLAAPSVPLVSCVDGRRVADLEPAYFWRAIREPMRVVEAARDIAMSCDSPLYLDLGPTGTMASLVGYLPAEERGIAMPSMSQFGTDVKNLEAIRAACRRRRPPPRKAPGSRLAWVFPGQGAQRRGMGAELFGAYPQQVHEADDVLGYSIEELCLADPDGRLADTRYTQPALFVVNALHALRLSDEAGSREPDFVAGHSLGEYNALAAAGVLDFRSALTVVKHRGELMAGCRDGGMAAVIGMTEQEVRAVMAVKGLEQLDIANLNSTTQIVVSGPSDVVRAARSIFEAAGCRHYVPLRVSGAFHSRLMRPAAMELAERLRDVTMSSARIPLISNVTARPMDSAEVRDRMVEQLVRPVRWTETIRFLLDRGVDEFIEVGPGQVLTKLIRDIRTTPHRAEHAD